MHGFWRSPRREATMNDKGGPEGIDGYPSRVARSAGLGRAAGVCSYTPRAVATGRAAAAAADGGKRGRRRARRGAPGRHRTGTRWRTTAITTDHLTGRYRPTGRGRPAEAEHAWNVPRAQDRRRVRLADADRGRRFQTANGVTSSGALDTATWAQLDAGHLVGTCGGRHGGTGSRAPPGRPLAAAAPRPRHPPHAEAHSPRARGLRTAREAQRARRRRGASRRPRPRRRSRHHLRCRHRHGGPASSGRTRRWSPTGKRESTPGPLSTGSCPVREQAGCSRRGFPTRAGQAVRHRLRLQWALEPDRPAPTRLAARVTYAFTNDPARPVDKPAEVGKILAGIRRVGTLSPRSSRRFHRQRPGPGWTSTSSRPRRRPRTTRSS